MLSVFILSVFMLSVFMLSVFLVSVFVLSVVMLSIIMLSVVAPRFEKLSTDKHSSLILPNHPLQVKTQANLAAKSNVTSKV
jgi:hypothetical protein